jgi:mannose-6-phosphate isomerase-like protein (cupin superfamily)
MPLCNGFGYWGDLRYRAIRNATITEWEAAGCPAAPGRPGEGTVVATDRGGRPATARPRSSLHVHRHDDEVFYVLDGEIKLQVGDDVHRLTQGMLGFGPHGVQHNFIVTSKQARLLVMTTPSGFENLVRAAGEPASEVVIPESMAPPDRAVFLAQNAERGIEILGPPMTLD